jgi:hypothetical protein
MIQQLNLEISGGEKAWYLQNMLLLNLEQPQILHNLPIHS